VPYIANLENGRGNPTVGALSRLAAALDRRLVVGLASAADTAPRSRLGLGARSGMPASLSRFARTTRFRRTAAVIADAAGSDARDFSVGLLDGLATLSHSLGRDLGEADWARLLDAVLLVSAHPQEGERDD
jgi:transcriptional regulator with XRE-family HTH domain